MYVIFSITEQLSNFFIYQYLITNPWLKMAYSISNVRVMKSPLDMMIANAAWSVFMPNPVICCVCECRCNLISMYLNISICYTYRQKWMKVNTMKKYGIHLHRQKCVILNHWCSACVVVCIIKVMHINDTVITFNNVILFSLFYMFTFLYVWFDIFMFLYVYHLCV